MSNQLDPHVQIARKIRSIETIKLEMLQKVVDLYKAVQTGSERDVSKDLAALIGTAYLFGIQIGRSPKELDQLVQENLPRSLMRDEQDIVDIEAVKRHFVSKR